MSAPTPSSDRVVIADGHHLFVLEDEALLFSGPRQELYLLNASAAFVWCCLEEGYDVEEVRAAYLETFSLDEATGRRHVDETLRSWATQGFIAGGHLASSPPTSKEECLARLLDPSRAPSDIESERVGLLAQSELEPDLRKFVAEVKASDLERQAALLRRKRERRHDDLGVHAADSVFVAMAGVERSRVDSAVRGRRAAFEQRALEHRYGLLTTKFCLRFSSGEHESWTHPAFAHLEKSSPDEPDVVFDIVEDGGYVVVLQDSVPVESCERITELAPLLKSRMMRIATDAHDFFLQIHGAVLTRGGRGLLLPAPPGHGKTTLTVGLARAGWECLSDELALLDEEDMEATPVPLALGIKSGAAQVLAPLWPEITSLPVHVREDGELVRYLTTPISGADAVRRVRLTHVVFPWYRDGAETVLRPLGKAEALTRMMNECLAVRRPLNRTNVSRLAEWIRGAETYDLVMGPLAEAIPLVESRILDR